MTSTAVDNAFYSSSTFKFGCLTHRTSRRTALLYIEVTLEGRSVCPPRWTDSINPEINCSEIMVTKRAQCCKVQASPGFFIIHN